MKLTITEYKATCEQCRKTAFEVLRYRPGPVNNRITLRCVGCGHVFGMVIPKGEFVGLELQEMDEIIDGNVTITDSKLRDGAYGIVLDTMTVLMEKNGYNQGETDDNCNH